jgi:4-aminobutyrate aminotransferase-like enzyme
MGAHRHARTANDPAVVRAVLDSLPFVVERYAHSDIDRASAAAEGGLIASFSCRTPRHFVVNTGQAVENAIKARLMNADDLARRRRRVHRRSKAFHGRTLGALAVTHRKKARLSFRRSTGRTSVSGRRSPLAERDGAARKRSLKQPWDLLVSGRIRTRKNKDIIGREIDALDDFLSRPGQD